MPYVTVSGITVDSNGVPVPDVEVWIEGASGGTTESGTYRYHDYGNVKVRSDEQGTYSLITHAYQYELVITPPTNSGFSTASIDDVDITSQIIQGMILVFDDVTPPPPVILAGPFINAIGET